MKKLDNYLNKLDENLLIFDLKSILKEFHKNNYKKVIPLIKKQVHPSTYYYWLSGKSPIPLKFLRLFSRFDKNLLNLVYENISYLSAGNKKCSLPKIINKDLAYMIGAIHGDGHMHKNGKYITLTVDSKKYIDNVLAPIFKKIFNLHGQIYDLDTCYRLNIGSKVCHSFFSLFCPVGKKTLYLKVPNEIRFNKSLLVSYLSGLFDTDGCVGYTKNKKQVYFTFVQSSKSFVFDVYNCLVYLGLHVNKPRVFYSPTKPYAEGRLLKEWRIYIGSKKDLFGFLSKVNFLHPLKSKKTRILKTQILKKVG